MNAIVKLILIILTFITVFTVKELRAEDSNIGLTVGIDYVSRYMKNGQYHFLTYNTDGDTVILPYMFFNVFDTGLKLGIQMVMSEAWLGGSSEAAKRAYAIERLCSLDFNAEYEYSLKDIVKFNLGAWYYRYRTTYYGVNDSYFEYYLSIAANTLPLTPTLAANYCYYTNKEWVRGFVPDYYDSSLEYWLVKPGNGKNEDVYVQFSIEHKVELAEIVYLNFGASVGFYHKKTNMPKSFDISDIDLSAGISTKWNSLTFLATCHYIIVPGNQFKNSYEYPIDDWFDEKDRFRSYVEFGVSCSI